MLRAAQLAMLLALPTFATAQEPEPCPKPNTVAERAIEDVHKFIDLDLVERELSPALNHYLKDPTAKDAKVRRAKVELLSKKYKALKANPSASKSDDLKDICREFTETASSNLKQSLNVGRKENLLRKHNDLKHFHSLISQLYSIEKSLLASKLLVDYVGDKELKPIELNGEYLALYNSLLHNTENIGENLLNYMLAEPTSSDFFHLMRSVEVFNGIHKLASVYIQHGLEPPDHLKPYIDVKQDLDSYRETFNSRFANYAEIYIGSIQANNSRRTKELSKGFYWLSRLDIVLNGRRTEPTMNVYKAIDDKFKEIFDQLAVAIEKKDQAGFDRILDQNAGHYTLLAEVFKGNAITDSKRRPQASAQAKQNIAEAFNSSYQTAYDELGAAFVNNDKEQKEASFESIAFINNCYEDLLLIFGEPCGNSLPYFQTNPNLSGYAKLSQGLKASTKSILEKGLNGFFATGQIDHSMLEDLDFNLSVMYILKTQKLLDSYDYDTLPLRPSISDINFNEINNYRTKLVDYILDPNNSQSKTSAYELLIRLEALADKRQSQEDFKPIASLVYSIANRGLEPVKGKNARAKELERLAQTDFRRSRQSEDYKQIGQLMASSFQGIDYGSIYAGLDAAKKVQLASLITNANRRGKYDNLDLYFSPKQNSQAGADSDIDPEQRKYIKALQQAVNPNAKLNTKKFTPSQVEVLRLVRAINGIGGHFGELENMPNAAREKRGRPKPGDEDLEIAQQIFFQANLARLTDSFFDSLGNSDYSRALRNEYNRLRFLLFESKLNPSPASKQELDAEAFDDLAERITSGIDSLHPALALRDLYEQSSMNQHADSFRLARERKDYCYRVWNSAWDARYTHPETTAKALSQYMQYLLRTEDLKRDEKLTKLQYLRDFFCGVDGDSSEGYKIENKKAMGYLDYVPDMDYGYYELNDDDVRTTKFAESFLDDFYNSIAGLTRSERGTLLGWLAAVTDGRFDTVFYKEEFEDLDFNAVNFDAGRRALKN